MRKSNFTFLCSILFVLTLSNCTMVDPVRAELEINPVLVFGTYYGFCGGDCAHLYKIENQKLYADQGIDNLYLFRDRELPFATEPRPEEDYAKAKFLISDFPNQLLQEEQQTLGNPDAHDQGGIFLELTMGEEVKKWYLDTSTERLPEYLQEYAKQVMAVVEML